LRYGLNRDWFIGHGSRDRSGGYGFPPELDDPIDEDINAEIYLLQPEG
jgi:hypothetical protein